MYIDLRTHPTEVRFTYKCNLSCPSCNVLSFCKVGHPPDLTTESFNRILDLLEQHGFLKQLSILGGEPTLHPKFVDFINLAHSRGFFMKLYTNAYSQRSRDLVYQVREKVWNKAKHKQKGEDLDLWAKTVFCAPKDLKEVPGTCSWEMNCGFSADELGFSVCTLGNTVCYWQHLDWITWDLEKLLDPEWQERAKKELCQYCGAFLDQEMVQRKVSEKYKNTLMTKSWLDAVRLKAN